MEGHGNSLDRVLRSLSEGVRLDPHLSNTDAEEKKTTVASKTRFFGPNKTRNKTKERDTPWQNKQNTG